METEHEMGDDQSNSDKIAMEMASGNPNQETQAQISGSDDGMPKTPKAVAQQIQQQMHAQSQNFYAQQQSTPDQSQQSQQQEQTVPLAAEPPVSTTMNGSLYKEFLEGGAPVVTFSFIEDVPNHAWIVNLIWPTEKRSISWRGKFCFHLSVYLKTVSYAFTRVLTKVSTPFSIFSKPDVFLKKQRGGHASSSVDSPTTPIGKVIAFLCFFFPKIDD